MQATSIDYELFCARPCGLYRDWHSPFVKDGFLYCTNGYLAIRHSTEAADSFTTNQRLTPVVDMFAKLSFPDTDSIDCPSVDGPPPEADKWWHAGTVEKCDICDGSGEHTCDCGCEHECSECKGTGEVESNDLVYGSNDRICVSGIDYQRQFIWRISQLPCAKLYPLSVDSRGALPFTFDGGIGIVMPYKK